MSRWSIEYIEPSSRPRRFIVLPPDYHRGLDQEDVKSWWYRCQHCGRHDGKHRDIFGVCHQGYSSETGCLNSERRMLRTEREPEGRVSSGTALCSERRRRRKTFEEQLWGLLLEVSPFIVSLVESLLHLDAFTNLRDVFPATLLQNTAFTTLWWNHFPWLTLLRINNRDDGKILGSNHPTESGIREWFGRLN